MKHVIKNYLLPLQWSAYSSAHSNMVLQNVGKLLVKSSATIGFPITVDRKRTHVYNRHLIINCIRVKE